ncbi:MAG TPA: hypothetical protein VFP12_11015 [Allosphingosinicella sp.]|nr:hypothetical protein [Allosphingosinicella sp.]
MRPDPERAPQARKTSAPDPSLSMRMAKTAGLTGEAKTRHLNAKVQPALFEAAARRVGSQSPAVVIEAALAALATQDDLGPWLATQWGVLADVDPELLGQIDV